MKTSVSLFLSDILPSRRRMFHKIVKNQIFDGFNPEEGLKHLKKQGIDGIEVCLSQYYTTTDADIEDLKQILKKADLPVLSLHQALRFFTSTKVPEITRLFEIAKALNVRLVVLHMNSAQKQIFDPRYIDALHELEDKYKIKVTFENMEKHIGSLFYEHRWHDVKFSELVYKTDFHITLDVVHLAHSGGDIIEFYKKHKDRIINIHLSDYKKHVFNNNIRPMRYKHMPLGEGQLPIKEFLDLLHKEKYDGLVTMEIHGDINDICDGAKQINAAKGHFLNLF
jgi:sugar phosphate isomerase/epimerase